MKLVDSVAEVADVVNRVKTGAPGFVTNFYWSPPRIQAWVDHRELLVDTRGGAAFFLRKDREFRHFFFCAADRESLANALAALPPGEFNQLTTDVVGPAGAVDSELQVLETRGFLPTTRLVRLCRAGAQSDSAADVPNLEIGSASVEECPAVLVLLEELFDPLVYQVPALYELEAASKAHQILVIRQNAQVRALLFFETQGVSSTLRFWAVSPGGRSLGLGSTLLRHYFKLHPAVRRFVLWVDEANQYARDKYSRFGYSPDGLFDHILLSPDIRK